MSPLSLLLGHYAYIAQTPDKRPATGISWSLGLTGEAGYLVALLAGLFVANVLPSVAVRLKPAARPEWFIKTAIVLLGAGLGVKAAGAAGLVTSIMFRGLAAIIEAYLIYWALVYLDRTQVLPIQPGVGGPAGVGDLDLRRLGGHHDRGGDPRRPVVPIMVSSLVVIFSVVELLVLPLAAREFLWKEPLVAAAWMGLAVKTDGAAVASGAITDALIRARALEAGIAYEAGWILTTTTTVKVFIDVFIGIWALVLSFVWTYGIERKPGANGPGPRRSETIPGFRLRVFRPLPRVSWSDAGPAGYGPGARRGDCPDRALARSFLRDDLLHDRDGFRPQTPLGRRDRPACPGLRRQPLRLHHLDRTGDLVALLPWSAAADHYREALN